MKRSVKLNRRKGRSPRGVAAGDVRSPLKWRKRFFGRKRQGSEGGTWSWWAAKRPVVRFVLVFGLLVAGFNAFFYLYLSRSSFFDAYMNLNAGLSARILRVFGERAAADGASLASPKFSLEIKRGCDALQASAFFVLGILSSPLRVSLLSRLPFLAVGTLVLLMMNLVRILSLYYTGVYFPKAFEIMHIEVWQPLFIFLPLFFWVVWARWTARSEIAAGDVST